MSHNKKDRPFHEHKVKGMSFLCYKKMPVTVKTQ